jgi:four helix bundle protein
MGAKDDLKLRTKQFALRVIRLVEALPKGKTGDILGKQLLRSATSVAANYRAACKARSKADFVSKITIVEEESDESLFWLELILEAGLMPEKRLQEIIVEANQLTAIFTASGKTAKQNLK